MVVADSLVVAGTTNTPESDRSDDKAVI